MAKKAEESYTDPILALLNYRASPLKHGLSPVGHLFNRKPRTTLPNLVTMEKKQQIGMYNYKIQDNYNEHFIMPKGHGY